MGYRQGRTGALAGWLAGWSRFLGGLPWAPGGTRQEFGGAPRCGGQADSRADGPRPAVGNAACCPQPADQLRGPQGKDRDSSGDSDNDFVKETAFCPNKTLWERDTAVSLFTEMDNSSVPIHLLRKECGTKRP